MIKIAGQQSIGAGAIRSGAGQNQQFSLWQAGVRPSHITSAQANL
jgi:hypothetical protein